MRKLGWGNAATLMERWLGGAKNSNPRSGHADTSTVKMSSWALTFPRAKAEFDRITGNKIWMEPRAKQQLTKQLRAEGKLSHRKVPFGDLAASAQKLESDYVTYGVVGAGFLSALNDPLDDMFGALGAFLFRVAPAGQVEPISRPNPAGPSAQPLPSTEWKVTIDKVGIYINDSYNFNDDQPLGYWDFENGTVSKNPLSGRDVTNQTFREWRNRTGKGGDFLVFSDVLVHQLPQPDSYVTK